MTETLSLFDSPADEPTPAPAPVDQLTGRLAQLVELFDADPKHANRSASCRAEEQRTLDGCAAGDAEARRTAEGMLTAWSWWTAELRQLAEPVEEEHQAAEPGELFDVAGYSFERPHADHVTCPLCGRSFDRRAQWVTEGRPNCPGAVCVATAQALAASEADRNEPGRYVDPCDECGRPGPDTLARWSAEEWRVITGGTGALCGACDEADQAAHDANLPEPSEYVRQLTAGRDGLGWIVPPTPTLPEPTEAVGPDGEDTDTTTADLWADPLDVEEHQDVEEHSCRRIPRVEALAKWGTTAPVPTCANCHRHAEACRCLF